MSQAQARTLTSLWRGERTLRKLTNHPTGLLTTGELLRCVGGAVFSVDALFDVDVIEELDGNEQLRDPERRKGNAAPRTARGPASGRANATRATHKNSRGNRTAM